MKEVTTQKLQERIKELELRLEESEQLIDAIKAGEVDAFAINNKDKSEIYTLHSGDYAYRILIEEFAEGAVNITEEGLIVYTNPYFLELLGLTYAKVIGATFREYVHQNSIDEFDRLFINALSGKSKGEINLVVHNKTIPVYVSLTSLQPKLETVGITITDFTEKKKIENVILEYQKSLENKNIELTQNNEELASFAYIASHDLQEPLRKIQTFASRIQEKEFDSLSDKGKDHFNRMQVSARRMQNLIKDLLTYSRTNTQERDFIKMDLNDILNEVLEELSEEIKQKKAIIEASKFCEVDVIPFQFRQLLHNLLNNSLKFNKPDQQPRILIKCKISKGVDSKSEKFSKEKFCHITISDNGIGFNQQYNEKIFELFQRLHVKSQYNGTGIGLAIVKKIVINHNGYISAKSEINKGTTFDIYIPLEQQSKSGK